ncbi:hypothetical protein Neosp_007915 [[Neocosmospora] mangrovei]|uniref:Uncharacterized protein n=1 Tax=Fusarium vanettenii (strain ATCC MYA-4622 / CBS 123669 / FGSC 9596 / NRRL 45880 / 77-13-4) TaxID=660122 RepID=C7ZGB3_FUSV7|nr:uncharacterized protein NECHADRAFT_88941 [Fusarium vanettenii 77-13-4]XP_003042598.1 uncharacterized protein NECHADRAFT_80985 [Fusarium vanettenii 77-13-4]EEU36779.1 predicted protein [Fusarium vanettenii 77-13-4]EEU36885.1 predicted protein [Fusarium vanettenii 77-13-4]
MASATFTQNFVTVDADPTVGSINLGFTEGDNLQNNKGGDAPITGKSTLAIVKYEAGGQARAFNLTKPIVFPPLTAIKITGGAKKDNTLKAVDDHGNEAIWSLA